MANESEMRRPGSRTGSSRRTMASNSEKIALVAPMPSAREAMLNSAKTRLRREQTDREADVLDERLESRSRRVRFG